MSRDEPEAVCSQPDLLEAHAAGSKMIPVAATCTPANGHAWQCACVHRHGIEEAHLAIQSRASADHLVAIGSRESAAHGRRVAPDSMLLAASCKTEIRDQKGRGAAFGGLGGGKPHRISP